MICKCLLIDRAGCLTKTYERDNIWPLFFLEKAADCDREAGGWWVRVGVFVFGVLQAGCGRLWGDQMARLSASCVLRLVGYTSVGKFAVLRFVGKSHGTSVVLINRAIVSIRLLVAQCCFSMRSRRWRCLLIHRCGSRLHVRFGIVLLCVPFSFAYSVVQVNT